MDEDTKLHPARNLQVLSGGVSPPGLLAALPDGWVMIGRCRNGTAGPANYPTGCFALAHPGTGVALIDIAPDATPNAEARLRRTLAGAHFADAYPGVLPIWHGRMDLSSWRSLPAIVAEGFSELPPLTVPGQEGWVAAARAALASDPAWDVPRLPGAPLPVIGAPSFDEDEPDEVPPALAPRSGLRRFGLPIGFALTFAFGLASGTLLLSRQEDPPAPARAERTAAVVPAAPAQPAAPLLPQPAEVARAAPAEPQPPPVQPTAAPSGVLDTAAATPAPAPTAMPAVPAAAEPPPAAQAAGSQAASLPDPAQSVAALLPLPPVAPKAPVKAAQPASPIDKACSRALYRFAQGESLTATEKGYLREGCSTRR